MTFDGGRSDSITSSTLQSDRRPRTPAIPLPGVRSRLPRPPQFVTRDANRWTRRAELGRVARLRGQPPKSTGLPVRSDHRRRQTALRSCTLRVRLYEQATSARFSAAPKVSYVEQINLPYRRFKLVHKPTPRNDPGPAPVGSRISQRQQCRKFSNESYNDGNVTLLPATEFAQYESRAPAIVVRQVAAVRLKILHPGLQGCVGNCCEIAVLAK